MARRGTLKAPKCEPLFFIREEVHQLPQQFALHAVLHFGWIIRETSPQSSKLRVSLILLTSACRFKIGHPAQRGNKSGLQSLFLRKPNGGPAIQDAVTVIMHFQRFSLFNNAGDIGFQDTAHHQPTTRCERFHISCHIRQ